MEFLMNQKCKIYDISFIFLEIITEMFVTSEILERESQ